jgi:hypothetical protein
MIQTFRRAAAGLLLFLAACAVTPPSAVAREPAVSAWEGVARVVVIGDLHGDYDKFRAMAAEAGLIDADGNWAGGRTHLVQLGDVPDRGDHTRRILDHLMKLEPQAISAGGRVHALIGNHEAMNMLGDLRYVAPGEYAAFVDRESERRRDAYYRQTIRAIRAAPPPGGLPKFDDAHRAAWNAQFPLGFVEHRLAWSPDGTYGKWIARNNAVIRINDMLFMHAGLGPAFLPPERDAMNDAVRAALKGAPDPAMPDIAENEQGPLWYRGLAINAEAVEAVHLEALLARHSVARVVVGHTKRAAMILPRFGGRVIITDVAVPEGSVDPRAFLIVENGGMIVVHRGQRVPLTDDVCAYVALIAALDPPEATTRRLVPSCGAPGGATMATSGSGS